MGIIGNGILGLGEQGIIAGRRARYLLLDRFLTDDPAPIASPRTCQPGPGTLTVVDTNSIIGISSGKVHVNGNPAVNDGIISQSTFARKAGRAFLWEISDRTRITSQHRFGLAQNPLAVSDLDIGLDYQDTDPNAIRIKTGVTVIDSNVPIGSDVHHFAAIMRGSGGFLLARNGGSGPYTLHWVYNTISAALYTKFWSGPGSANFKIDNFRVVDLGGRFATDYGLATSRLTSPVVGQEANNEADALIDFTFTHSNVVSTNIYYRRVDANNYYEFQSRASDGLVFIRKWSGGVASTKWQSAVGFAVNGQTYRVVIKLDDSTHILYINNVKQIGFTDAEHATATTMRVVAAGGGVAELVGWPLRVSLPLGV